MNYLLIAITAYLLNAISVTIDKILLVKKLPNPALYVFYISLFSLTALFLTPFTTIPNSYALLISSFSTILWTVGAFFMFKALKNGEAARVVPIIGTLIPIILLAMSAVSGSVNSNELTAVIILLIGLVFLIFPFLGISFRPRELAHLKGKFSKEELLLELVSAFLFANSYFLLKIAYDDADFLSIFVYSRFILIPIIAITLLIPLLRRSVFGNQHTPPVNFWSKTGLLLFLGQAAGGASQMMLTFAISLANPAIINSIQGIQYVFLFILSLLLVKKFPTAFSEKLTRVHMAGKIIGILFIFFGLWILSLSSSGNQNPQTGVTFSSHYARELGLSPNETFEKILTELNPKIIRLPVYWDEVEKEMGQLDFSETESFLEKAQKNNTDIILVVGFKQPRWPECFRPDWTNDLSDAEFDKRVINLVKSEVETFKKYSTIKYWQVENEPYVDFGICPRSNPKRLLKEIEIVKSLDPRPILITDSGELSTWIPTIQIGDAFGTTLYRTVWSPWFGSISYPLPPIFYNIKSGLAKSLTGNIYKTVMISELQAEPWPDEHAAIYEISSQRQIELFPNQKLLENYNYAKETNLGPILFWGVEWWYYIKQNGDPSYWELAKRILQNEI